MKPILFGRSDSMGGASIAAYRIHRSLLSSGVESRLWVDRKSTDDWTVQASAGQVDNVLSKLRPLLGNYAFKPFIRDSMITQRSYNWIPSRWRHRLNASDADIIHLNWFNNEALSIADVANLNKPIVQTLHDMWPFCGAEHYTEDQRWKAGYSRASRPSSQSGIDVDRYTYLRKKRQWTQPWHLVAISQWMADCISSSSLFNDWPVTLIPNPVDTTIWKPMDKAFSRTALNLPVSGSILSFGAVGGTRNPRKGYRLMVEALERLKRDTQQNIHVVVFGEGQPKVPIACPFPVTYLGRLNDPASMVLLNNAADVLINPAVQEAFGQTGSEAHACALPVAAFDGTGLADIVEHRHTGYLAKPGNAADLAHGIEWILANSRPADTGDTLVHGPLGLNARARALKHFSYGSVADRYVAVYEQAIRDHQNAQATRP